MSVTLKLKQPIVAGEGEGAQKIESVTFDFEKLTGADFIFCEGEAARRRGQPVLYHELDSVFRLEVMAKASGVARDLLIKMALPDYAEADRGIRDFLTSSASD